VLDAPALDWDRIVSWTGAERGIPGWITALGKQATTLRTGLDWNELSQPAHADAFATPILIFHGDADDTVPLEVSEAFAAARPELVTLHVFESAGHVESANVDRTRYAETIEAWLRGLGIGGNGTGPE
jgi:fermentation-respiration switch protein FrsA (DUF1100 family)